MKAEKIAIIMKRNAKNTFPINPMSSGGNIPVIRSVMGSMIRLIREEMSIVIIGINKK